MITVLLTLITSILNLFIIFSMSLIAWILLTNSKSNIAKGILLGAIGTSLGIWVVQATLMITIPAPFPIIIEGSFNPIKQRQDILDILKEDYSFLILEEKCPYD